ncbi:MAG: TlpA disulfide reductase family protein [Bacteroidia bacterium]|nr:TlpA disulfide reductase family protein [Bacteroidia bacterium]
MKIIRWINSIIVLSLFGVVTSCQPGIKPLKEGLWRGAFILPQNEIPFVFEVKGKSADSTLVYLINGTDRFLLKNTTYGNDSVTIPIDLYSSVLKGKLTENSIEGQLVKVNTDKPVAGVPFKAEFGNLPRFPKGSEIPSVSLTGTWDMNMISSDNTEKTVGNFDQKESLLTGSILTTTGDYRFLEGVVDAKKFALSAFGGSTPYLLKGEFLSDSTFSGEFITPRQTSKIEGKRNLKAALPDPYMASSLKEGFTSIEFSFPNLEGKQVSLSDPIYKGKVVIVTILGSWCPNCLDENAFLSSWYKENHQRGVEIIGLGFERKNDFESAKKSLSNLKTRLDIQYEILFAGQSDTANASKALPALNGIAAFPTTIFIDKKGNVRKVHTGFSGPATGKFYDEFKVEFNKLIDSLLAE